MAKHQLPPLDTTQRYTVDEALDYLRIGRTWFYELVSTKAINLIHEGRRTFVPGTEIARLSRVDRAGGER